MTAYTVGARLQQCIVDGFYLVRQGEDRPPVAYVPDRDTAEHMARVLNSQQVLVEALRKLVAVIDREPDRECPAAALQNARTALQLAEGRAATQEQP